VKITPSILSPKILKSCGSVLDWAGEYRYTFAQADSFRFMVEPTENKE
jgi:hypothetical protein